MEGLTMESKISLSLAMVLATLTILAPGCSPTGWAVREIPDGSGLQPGENVTVIQHDGKAITGKYVGTTTIAEAEYISQYERAAQSAVSGTILPAIGQNVEFTTVLGDMKPWMGQLTGFDLENIWIRFPGNTESEPIYFSNIHSLMDGNGGIIRRTMLRGLFLNGAIPLMSALKFKNGTGEISVPISSIKKLEVLDETLSYRTIDGNALREKYQ
jgi:hypothetical protein